MYGIELSWGHVCEAFLHPGVSGEFINLVNISVNSESPELGFVSEALFFGSGWKNFNSCLLENSLFHVREFEKSSSCPPDERIVR